MNVIERIKTLLFVGLFVSSVVLATVYFAGAPRRESTAGSDLPSNVLAAIRGGDGSPAISYKATSCCPPFLASSDRDRARSA